MRLHEIPTSLLCVITLLSHTARPVAAYAPLEESMPHLEDRQLAERGCANPCGYYGQLCCLSGEVCYTDSNNQAQCSQGSNGGVVTTTITAGGQTTQAGQYSVITTTYLQTDLQTITTTYTSYYPAGPTTIRCSYSSGETPCGSCCCKSGEMCAAPGQCVNGASSAYYSSFMSTFQTSVQTVIVPLRPTSQTTVQVTSTGVITTTVPYQTPVSTDGAILTGVQASTSSGLSGGAIAGIVIGIIIGLILLLLLCACLCFKSLWDGLRSIFGIRSPGRRRTEVTEYERRSDRRHSGWFGGAGPARGSRRSDVEVVEKEKRGSRFGGFTGVAAGLGALALLLGLKRRRDRRREEDKNSMSYDSNYSDEYTSASK